MDEIPKWMNELEPEDIKFIKLFILSSGSLKEIATIYGVTYPTVRLRLDRLIAKINLSQNEQEDEFITAIKHMALDEKITYDSAKLIITKYKQSKGD